MEGLTVGAPYGLGEGLLLTPAVASPAAGAGFTVTVPANFTWIVAMLNFTLAAANAGAARTVTCSFQDANGTVYANVPSTGTQAINTTNTHTFGASLEGLAVNVGTSHATGLPHWRLEVGWQVVVAIQGVQGADQISAIGLAVRAFPTGPDFYPDAPGE